MNISHAQAPKTGGNCTKVSQVVKVGTLKLYCTRINDRLVWSNKRLSNSITDVNSQPGIESPQKKSTLTISEFRKMAFDSMNSSPTQPDLDTANTVKITVINSSGFSNLINPNQKSLYKYYGPELLKFKGNNSLESVGVFNDQTKSGSFKSLSALPPWGVGFTLTSSDTSGRFEVLTANHFVPGAGEPYQTRSWRLAFKKQGDAWKYQSLTGTPHPIDGKTYRDQVILGSSGTFEIRLEFEAGTNFLGIALPDSNSKISSDSTQQSPNVVIIGDSFTHPTLGEIGPYHEWDGYPLVLNWLTGWNVIPEGVNGQGLLQQSAGETFSDRITRDVLPLNPQVVIIVASTNDYCPSCKFSSEDIGKELEKDIEKLQTADPKILIITTTSFLGNPNWAKSLQTAANNRKIPFINFLEPPLIDMSQPNNPYVNGHPTRQGGLKIATGLLTAIANLN